MKELEQQLTEKLYRVICPDSIVLGEYHLGLLDKKQAQQIKLHLQECPHCRQEIARLDEYLQTVEPDIDVPVTRRWKQTKRIIAHFLSEGLNSLDISQPALAPVSVRGSDKNASAFYDYDAEEWRISIDVQEDDNQPDHKSIAGLILGPASSWQVDLKQEGETVASASVDNSGNFILNDLPAGTYQLIIYDPTTKIEIVIQNLII